MKRGQTKDPDFRRRAKQVLTKIRKQVTKDYVVHPILSGPSAPFTVAANFTANTVRNLWTHSVIMCGHFPNGVETFSRRSIVGETKGEWYLRQMLGSANISGSKAMHLMTGNLSYQIEHHLYPDLPSNRYQEIAPKVQAVFEKYGLTYVTGPLPKQVGSAWAKIIRLSFPNDFFHKTPVVAPVVQLFSRSSSRPRPRPPDRRTATRVRANRDSRTGEPRLAYARRVRPAEVLHAELAPRDQASVGVLASRRPTPAGLRPWWIGVATDAMSPSRTAR